MTKMGAQSRHSLAHKTVRQAGANSAWCWPQKAGGLSAFGCVQMPFRNACSLLVRVCHPRQPTSKILALVTRCDRISTCFYLHIFYRSVQSIMGAMASLGVPDFRPFSYNPQFPMATCRVGCTPTRTDKDGKPCRIVRYALPGPARKQPASIHQRHGVRFLYGRKRGPARRPGP